MISASDRRKAVELIKEAHANGARLFRACQVLEISIRTYQRWTQGGDLKEDGRPGAHRQSPSNRLKSSERNRVLAIANSPDYGSMPPAQIVANLADKGIYLASESSFYRILIVDIFSRFIVGWEVWEKETSEHAQTLIKRTCFKEGIRTDHQPLVLHSDNGSPMKAATFKATLEKLGITRSYSRPRVSNDNPYSESLFRTLKYRPAFPYQGFRSLQEAREWVQSFVYWYNEIHRHKALRFVTPGQRHRKEAKHILVQRREVFERAKSKTPERWGAREIRDLSLPDIVFLNPDNQDRTAYECAAETQETRHVS
ncbi:Integrase catalytic region [Dethiosulfovibrio peptidovorans DSM 11002]|uniref:Integrase catalytic region n=1 Tax=Dethiosulfovibrio peptidovorans DSM 11002 TaxID=469381 RepID=D2Z488_9BACT|nr:integrase core domain-containing protein [Dethiosulfovibrio peptidovorans]EFC90417.1 Integrase catalytic region [Dethiosulfovibrio peptidovorans DSM 11002]